jgi:hypothetical protein
MPQPAQSSGQRNGTGSGRCSDGGANVHIQICATYFDLFSEQWVLRQEIADPQCREFPNGAQMGLQLKNSLPIALMGSDSLTRGLKNKNLSTYLECRYASFLSPLDWGVILFRIGRAGPWDPAALLLPDIRHRLDLSGCFAPVWTEPSRWIRCKNLQLFEPPRKHFFQP